MAIDISIGYLGALVETNSIEFSTGALASLLDTNTIEFSVGGLGALAIPDLWVRPRTTKLLETGLFDEEPWNYNSARKFAPLTAASVTITPTFTRPRNYALEFAYEDDWSFFAPKRVAFPPASSVSIPAIQLPHRSKWSKFFEEETWDFRPRRYGAVKPTPIPLRAAHSTTMHMLFNDQEDFSRYLKQRKGTFIFDRRRALIRYN